MTCIVGLQHDGGVTMGGDSAGISGWDLTVRADPKVFRNGDFLIGFTSSFRMGQVLQYDWSPPERPEHADDFTYLVRDVVKSLRAVLKDAGAARNESGEESGGAFLLAYRAHLYVIESDFQVGLPAKGYAAVGCGAQIARGSLCSTLAVANLLPEKHVQLALQAAEAHSAGVCGPFVTLHQPSPGGKGDEPNAERSTITT